MARIIGGLAVSHTPTIGFAVDHDKQDEAAWAPIFQSFEPMKAWLQEKQPDVLFYIFNDHITSFFFDHYGAFSLGVDERYEVADEGGHPRQLPAVGGHAALARHIGESPMADEFDMSFFREKPLDHGFFSPMSALLPHDAGWPVQIVPLQVGVLQFPIPSAKRCYKLGQALRRGQLDALLTFWHFSARLRGEGGVQTAFGLADLLGDLQLDAQLPVLGYLFPEPWAQANEALLQRFASALRQSKHELASEPAYWQAIRPLMRAEDEAVFAALRDSFVAGIPQPLDAARIADLQRLLVLTGSDPARLMPAALFQSAP